MHDQAELRHSMSLVRSRGLVNADKLAEQVEKFSDWREHVRAHPWPIALAAAAIGYWMIPIRPKVVHTPRPAQGGSTGTAAARSSSHEEQIDQAATKAGLGGAALAFVASLAGNAIRSYISEQVQTLITSRGDHGASRQRQAPYTRN